MYCWELRLVYARLFFFFDLIWQLHTTGSGWASSMELMEEATKHPGPPLERTHMAVSNHHFFPHRIYRILLDSLDNANTCRDAVSVVKQVSTFAVWNHKRHYMRLTNQQGSSKKVSAVKEVQQKNIQIISPWADGSRRCKHGSRIMSTWYLRQQKERN